MFDLRPVVQECVGVGCELLGAARGHCQLWTQYQGHRSPVSHCSGEKSPKCDSPPNCAIWEGKGKPQWHVALPVLRSKVTLATTHLTRSLLNVTNVVIPSIAQAIWGGTGKQTLHEHWTRTGAAVSHSVASSPSNVINLYILNLATWGYAKESTYHYADIVNHGPRTSGSEVNLFTQWREVPQMWPLWKFSKCKQSSTFSLDQSM